MSPEVDKSLEKFSWSIPNFEEIKEYSIRNLRWNNNDVKMYFGSVNKKIEERKN